MDESTRQHKPEPVARAQAAIANAVALLHRTRALVADLGTQRARRSVEAAEADVYLLAVLEHGLRRTVEEMLQALKQAMRRAEAWLRRQIDPHSNRRAHGEGQPANLEDPRPAHEAQGVGLHRRDRR